jgi:predicted transcriptional regulator of viral defense system
MLAGTAPAIVARARAEYMEMPGLCLTVPQAARLLGVDVGESQRVLSHLENTGLLRRNERGLYLRRPCPRCA